MKIFLFVIMIVMMMAGLAMAQEATDTQDQAAPAAAAQEQAQVAAAAPAVETAAPVAAVEDDSFTMATVNGEISGMTKRAISIIYDRDYDSGQEFEMLIPVDEKTEYKHKNGLSDLKVGDLISIDYEKPGEVSKHKTRAATVNFIQSAVTGLTTKN